MSRRGILVACLIIVISTQLVARGGNEPEASPPPDAEASGPAVSDPPESTEADLVPPAPEPIPMDPATAGALQTAGVLAFSEKVPSHDFLLTDLDGNSRTLSEFRGKVVFLNFWATWCPPCREEMPAMQALRDELGTDNFEIVAVNVLESREVAAEFIEEMGFTYPVLLDLEGTVMLNYGIRAYPTTYVIDAEGYVLGIRLAITIGPPKRPSAGSQTS